MTSISGFNNFKVVVQESLDSTQPDLNIILKDNEPFLYMNDLDDAKNAANALSIYYNKIETLEKQIKRKPTRNNVERITDKRFQIFDRNNHEHVIDMEYALGFDDPNVDMIEFLGQSLTTLEMVDLLNEFNEKLESAELVLHNLGYELVYSETYKKWLIE